MRPRPVPPSAPGTDCVGMSSIPLRQPPEHVLTSWGPLRPSVCVEKDQPRAGLLRCSGAAPCHPGPLTSWPASMCEAKALLFVLPTHPWVLKEGRPPFKMAV